MQEFKFALFNAGSEVFFSVLDMPEKWRVEGAERAMDGVIVQSCSAPQILEEDPYDDDDMIPPKERRIQVFLWGTVKERDRSMEIHIADSELAAEIFVRRTRAALLEFAKTGAFDPNAVLEFAKTGAFDPNAVVSEETVANVTTMVLG